MSRLAGIRSDLETALSESIQSVKNELEASEDPQNATRLLAQVNAATQITGLIMQNLEETEEAEAARTGAGDSEADKNIARLSMGREALLTSLETLAQDLKN